MISIIVQSIIITIFQLLFFVTLIYTINHSTYLQHKVSQIIKFILIQILYIIQLEFENYKKKFTKTMNIEELLTEKLNNYTKFILESSLKPEKSDKILTSKATIKDAIIRVYALCQTYSPFLSSDGLEIEEYTKYWMKKYEKNIDDVKKEDLEKFQSYHLMFYDLLNKYIVQQQNQKK